jgi:hypothetical protein
MTEERRRSTDPLIQELIDEIRACREELKPIREFMTQINAAKLAAIWGLGGIAAIGATVKWVLDVKAEIHKGP